MCVWWDAMMCSAVDPFLIYRHSPFRSGNAKQKDDIDKQTLDTHTHTHTHTGGVLPWHVRCNEGVIVWTTSKRPWCTTRMQRKGVS